MTTRKCSGTPGLGGASFQRPQLGLPRGLGREVYRQRIPVVRELIATIVVGIAAFATCDYALSGDLSAIHATFPIESDGDFIVLPVQVGGQTYSFILDTGSFGLVFDVALRPQLGQPMTRGVSMTLGGRVEVEGFAPPLADAMLGPIPLRGAPYVWVVDLGPIREFTGYDVMGLIGIEPLSYKIVQIDFDSGQLRFIDHVSTDAGPPIPMFDTDGGQLSVAARALGEGQERFVLDTGYSATGTLPHPTFKKLYEEGRLSRVYTRKAVSAGGKRRSNVGSLDEFVLGTNTHFGLDFSSSSTSKLIGLGILSRYVVTLDFPSRQLHLAKGHRFGVPERRDMSGLAIARRDGRTIVTHVAKGSPAKDAGIQNDDELLEVDKMDARSERMFVLRKSLSQKNTDTVMLLRRGGADVKVCLPLRDWRVYDASGERGTRKGDKSKY